MKFVALTIGPIYKTLKNAKKTREIWGASYFFSFVIKEIVKKLVGKVEFITPYVEDEIFEKRDGVGLFHDRIIFKSDTVKKDELQKIVDEVLKASEKLDDVAIVSMPFISPFDEKEVKNMFEKYKKVYVVEEHFEEGGLGTILSDFAMKNRIDTNIQKIAIKNQYIHDIGDCSYLREKLGIDAKSIVKRVKHG